MVRELLNSYRLLAEMLVEEYLTPSQRDTTPISGGLIRRRRNQTVQALQHKCERGHIQNAPNHTDLSYFPTGTVAVVAALSSAAKRKGTARELSARAFCLLLLPTCPLPTCLLVLPAEPEPARTVPPESAQCARFGAVRK